MSEWKNFAKKIKEKRAAKCTKKRGDGESVKDEIIVQRMSSDVSGKAQKYSRIGPREFVPFDKYSEVTLENIIDACQKHFCKRIEKGTVCDVLAGEQGPSCRKLEHVPDLKVFYVRFLERHDLGQDVDEGDQDLQVGTQYLNINICL